MFLEHQISMLIQFCFAITGTNYISQYIEMQNSYYKLFVHVTFHYFYCIFDQTNANNIFHNILKYKTVIINCMYT